jgi:amidase
MAGLLRRAAGTLGLTIFVTIGAVAPPSVAPASAGPVPNPVLNGVDLQRVTIPELARAMDRHQLSSAELTAFYLRRTRLLNSRLHAVVSTNPGAQREAAASDLRRRTGNALGPLEGIPVMLKANIDTADGQPTTAGSFALLRARPARDAALVARLRAAGAVILGKTNLTEWAAFRDPEVSSGWSAIGGLTANPYVLDRNPCGSSSGSGVAAAAALATVTVGTDTNGSILCPSGVNGLVGVRPSLGLVSQAGIVPISAAQDTAGPMARNVTDAAIVLSVIQAKGGAYRLDPSALAGKRIGVWRRGRNSDVNRVTDEAVAAMRSLGATVIDNVRVDLGQADAEQSAALRVEFKHDINAYLASTPGEHPPDLAGLIAFNDAHADVEMPFAGQRTFTGAQATSGDLTDPAYRETRRRATADARAGVDGALAADRLDAIFTPANGPAEPNAPSGVGGTGGVVSSSPAAISGYPAVTVPAGFTADGVLPLGGQFFASRGSEAALLSYAFAFEQVTRARRAPHFLPTLG